MIKKLFAGFAIFSAGLSPLLAQTVSGFENIISTADSSYNGSNVDRGHISGSGHFWNSYTPSWGSWDGFAFSSISDTVTRGWANQYASIVGSGVNSSMSYAVAYNYARVTFSESTNGDSILGVSVSNSTYGYLSMKDGDPYAKKFGGSSGNDSDYFYIEFTGFVNGTRTASHKHYLADFRFKDNAKDYLQKDWQWVDLTSLGMIDELTLTFGSSDIDTNWGFINTPTYACIDSLVYRSSTTVFRPVAEDDQFYSNLNGSINEYDILYNDKDPDAGLTGANISILSDFFQATTQVLVDGTLKLTPKSDAYGWDSLSYKLTDSDNLSDSAKVKLLFNEAPMPANDLLFLGEPLYDTLIDLLVNDIDENITKAKVNILQSPKLGVATMVNGKIKYTTPNFSGVDTIRYSITDEFGLMDSANVYIVTDILSSANSKQYNSNLSIYPNPVYNYLYISSELKIENYQLMDLNGKMVLDGVYQESASIDLRNVEKGLYFLRLNSVDLSISKKVIVK